MRAPPDEKFVEAFDGCIYILFMKKNDAVIWYLVCEFLFEKQSTSLLVIGKYTKNCRNIWPGIRELWGWPTDPSSPWIPAFWAICKSQEFRFESIVNT